MEIDPRHGDYLPVNQYNVLRENLPDAELIFTKGFLHELLSIHSAEELDCVRKAGVLPYLTLILGLAVVLASNWYFTRPA